MTAASTAGSSAVASAKPPVKHMPTTPTPAPPHSPSAMAASARSQVATRLVRSARMVNSLEMHNPATDRRIAALLNGSPGRPNSDGRKTVYPASINHCANSTTPGCSPGISWMTITAGPVPARNTSWARPSWVNIEWSNPANEPACWVTTPPTFARCSCSQWERQQRHCQTVMSRSSAAPTTASSYGCPSGDAGTAHTDGSSPTSLPHPFDPATGRARLSYRRAAEIFTTASGGWTLHQLRHSRLTHPAEAGVGLPMLMTKIRHPSLASLAIYAKPTFNAVAAATAALDPDRRR